MNTHIYSFIGGVVVGATSIFVGVTMPMKKRLTEEVYSKFEDDIKVMRDYYQRKADEEQVKTDDSEDIYKDTSIDVEADTVPDIEEDDIPFVEETNTEDASYSAEVIAAEEGYTMINDETLHPGDDEYYHTDKNEAVGGIEHISDDVFQENEWGYIKVFMKYFPNDDVLLDTDNSAVEDVRGIVGDYLEDIRNNDLFAIVNHEKELLIEVERYDEPVGEYILGKIDPKDPFYNLTDKV